MRLREVKTIDVFVDQYIRSQFKDPISDIQSCTYIINVHISKLLLLLKSKHNRPSKHDLLLIKLISKETPDIGSEFESIILQILKIYKNRKE